ncbi:MAG: hypothetical protein ACKPKO_64965 [Candidatus Fonsibacter sp.]
MLMPKVDAVNTLALHQQLSDALGLRQQLLIALLRVGHELGGHT